MQSYFGCLLRTSNVGGAKEVGIGEFRVQPNITSITSIVENNSIRIVLVFIFVRFSNQLVYDKARYIINRLVLQCVGIFTWKVTDCEELVGEIFLVFYAIYLL
jgi:DNA integrity scanning protein DisA with diadenylate cyclase activity